MATHDYVIANGTGAAVRSDLNNALAAIVSQNSSATEPSPTYAYMPWADTTAGVMKMRNGANNGWIELFELDGELGSKVFNGNITLNAQGDLRFADSDSSNWVAFQAPATVASNVTWTLPATDGTAGQALTTNGSAVLSWATAGTVDYQEFTSSGTWTKPAGVTTVYVECIGGGGGGGSGRRGATSTTRSGGGGGAGGFLAFQQLVASAVSSTVTVTVGAGGTGGAAVTTNDTNGNAGTTGGASTFGSYVSSHASGGGGAGSTTSGASRGFPVSVGDFGRDGGGGVDYNGNPSTLCAFGATGGGGGGGVQSGNFVGAGGSGANGFVTKKTSYTPPAGGAAGGNPGANGSGEGDGGGGGSGNNTGAGGNGGNGGFPGGGGGGGGASLNGFNSGAGGNGAAGVVRVWSW